MWTFNYQLFLQILQKQSCTSPSVLPLFIAALWPVMAEGTWRWQTHFQKTPSHDGASSVGGKRADCNANFPATINLQYGIRALLPRGCALLLYSISQLLPAITVNPHCPPHTKPLLHYIYQALYKRRKHMTAALRAVFPPGLGGPLLEEGTFSWPTVHLFPGLGSSDTMRATDFLLHHIPATSYINLILKCLQTCSKARENCVWVWTALSDVCFWCMWDVANHLNVHL